MIYIQKPYPNFHSARIRAPGTFVRIRVLKTTSEGIMIYGGPLRTNPTGSTKVQAIRFPKDKFSVSESKEWLKEHNYTYILFEPATGKGISKTTEINEINILEIDTNELKEIFKNTIDIFHDLFEENINKSVTIYRDELVQKCELILCELEGRGIAFDDNLSKAVWTRRYINDLPDSAFLYIESGGEKDDEGKTKPRSLRHFPYKDKSGEIDLPHLRNAIGRIPQSKLSSDVKEKVQAKAKKLLEQIQEEKEKKGIEKEFVTVFIKSEEEKIVSGIVYEPDEVDSDLETANAVEVIKACYSFMEKSGKIKISHKGKPIKAVVLENYIAPVAFSTSGRAIKKGTWLISVRVKDENVWKLVKSGDLTGFSMAGMCQKEEIKE